MDKIVKKSTYKSDKDAPSNQQQGVPLKYFSFPPNLHLVKNLDKDMFHLLLTIPEVVQKYLYKKRKIPIMDYILEVLIKTHY